MYRISRVRCFLGGDLGGGGGDDDVNLIGFFVGGCGSFYAIAITSEAFRGLSMVKQHQLVNKTLKNEIETIHGLQVGHSISYIPVADFLYSASDDRT